MNTRKGVGPNEERQGRQEEGRQEEVTRASADVEEVRALFCHVHSDRRATVRYSETREPLCAECYQKVLVEHDLLGMA